MSAYVLISGDFTPWGGMDRANFELARYVATEMETAVHLVGFNVASPLSDHANVRWHKVERPLNAYILSERLLSRKGIEVAHELVAEGARVVVNGGNCPWPDINWIHAVHAVWDTRTGHKALPYRLQAAMSKHKARRDERRALKRARLLLTNSRSARDQIIESFSVAPERVHCVYYGVDSAAFYPPSPEERQAARSKLSVSLTRPLALFIGALGHDRNKGFDLLFTAWEQLCQDEAWDVDLIALGHGAEVDYWRQCVAARQLGDRIRIVGFSRHPEVWLQAADVLVSPTHYDSYGLGVHEALCCGLPAFVTSDAGIAERYPPELTDLLLDSPPNSADLVNHLCHWRANVTSYRERVRGFGQTLRRRSWSDMAREIVTLIEASV